MTTSSRTRSVGAETIAAGRLLQAAAIAAFAASLVNVLVYFVVPALFDFSLEIPLMGPDSEIEHLPVYMVIFATVAGSIGAVLVFAVFNRFTARPVKIFRVIALGFLLLSFGPPLSLPVATSIQLTLASMHVITAAIATYMLTTWAQETS
ncbi:MAG: DUF6069 family protein [Chloroflexi bacterium]|nr:DUF6069 family protein [Chloroflexota bacterium]